MWVMWLLCTKTSVLKGPLYPPLVATTVNRSTGYGFLSHQLGLHRAAALVYLATSPLSSSSRPSPTAWSVSRYFWLGKHPVREKET